MDFNTTNITGDVYLQTLKDVKKIQGGRANESFKGFDEENIPIFVKINRKIDGILQREAESLKMISKSGCLTPKVKEIGKDYLVLEFVQFVDKSEGNSSFSFGSQLRILHSNASERFGYHTYSYQGHQKLNNEWNDSWMDFFKENRWETLFQNLVTEKDREKEFTLYTLGMKISDIMEEIFSNSLPPQPRLLHGDLNPGNWGISKDGFVFYDPSVYFGDIRYDLACHNCWEDFDEEFWKGYCGEDLKMREWIDSSKRVFKLYHAYILISCYLFNGNRYLLKKGVRLMNELIAECSIKSYPSMITRWGGVEQRDVLLIQCGSYNPVHKNHIRNLLMAKEHFESLGNTVNMVMVLANEERIRRKCGKRRAFSLLQRFEMVKLVAEPHNISVDLSQLYEKELLDHLQGIFPGSRLVIVCGMDVLEYTHSHFPSDTEILTVKRVGYEDVSVDRIGFTIIDHQNEEKMSSTAIRNEEKAMRKFLDPNVFYFINK
eukprot:TRINITY_DN2527_c0_g3_i2.p1 TRINITY_DN2527_c0_g3~~TRINITY_DN2527_c0_g3_i2.p1  ORF type:complete len:489 (-),score=113.41 TRINITY_DN2527_c0_g3_i2:22-1488(-)